jgi:hypothetical protein
MDSAATPDVQPPQPAGQHHTAENLREVAKPKRTVRLLVRTRP